MSTAGRFSQVSLKQEALSFLGLVTSGKVREAYEKHVAPDFVHHNPYFRGDAQSLMQGMEENAAQFPHKAFEVQRALEDGDLVAVHSRVTLNPGTITMELVHIFRFRGNAIVELWDVGQPVPDSSANERGMF